MKYFSLGGSPDPVDFKTATLQGQAPDGGLYFPQELPLWEPGFVAALRSMDPVDMGTEIMQPYVGDTLSPQTLRRIVAETISFPIPLIPITENIHSLELFHGPTLAFKDVGARFMSRCLGEFARDTGEHIVVLVATSGDTGGAVAHGFHQVPGVDVVILYPSGKVSPVQEKQLTTLGGNIHTLEIAGDFDDCQRMVKAVFSDMQLRKQVWLSSANSINVARWLPQQLYYLLAWQQWPFPDLAPVVSVPSGNFGNICAGLLARHSGLPIGHCIAACNINDTVPRYLHSGHYQPLPAKATISNAMDVALPSNFIRIMEMNGQSLEQLKTGFSSVSFTDAETMAAMKRLSEEYGYVADPHGAIGFMALSNYLSAHPNTAGLFLETAHPVKFPEAVEAATGKAITIPPVVRDLLQASGFAAHMAADEGLLKHFILERFGH